ncbi:MAG: RCC1 domain-containing protein [Candidatus Izemoplasmatales bacterium]
MKKKIILLIFILNFILLACANQGESNLTTNNQTSIEENTTNIQTSLEEETQSIQTSLEETTYEVSYYVFPESFSSSHHNYLDTDDKIANIHPGFYHSLALSHQGRVFTWGNNDQGQLGNSTLDNQIIPTDITEYFQLESNETIIQLSAGGVHSMALSSNNRLFTWGNNDHSQLGDGTYGPASRETIPKDITGEFNLQNNETIVSIEAGTFHSSALTSENRLFLWGNNGKGQIGNNSTANQGLPLDITSYLNLSQDENIIQVSLGNYNTAIITSHHRLLIWGENIYGQLGNGNFNDSWTPLDITSFFSLEANEMITSISLGIVHSGALTNQGNLFMWGFNGEGLLGNQSTENSNLPIKINQYFSLDDNESIVNINLGGNHSSFITSNQQIYTWGQNPNGELGDLTFSSQNTPRNITDLFSIDEEDSIENIFLGIQTSFVISKNGFIYGFGSNNFGELGIQQINSSQNPSQVHLSPIDLLQKISYLENDTIELIIDEKINLSPWYYDKAFTQQVNDFDLITKDISLYAYRID